MLRNLVFFASLLLLHCSYSCSGLHDYLYRNQEIKREPTDRAIEGGERLKAGIAPAGLHALLVIFFQN
jgi:hypothetical protein